MKNEIFFVGTQYIPTSAATNRLFAFAHFLYGKGIKVHFFYLFPDKNCSKSDRYKDEFVFHYLWEGLPLKNKLICTASSLYQLRRYFEPDIPVYVYGLLNCLYFIRRNNNIKLYHEYTENPLDVGVVDNSIGRYLFKLYKQAVKQCDGLFVITPSLRDYYIEETGIDSQKVKVINMIVDEERFKGLDEVEPENRISYCGTISEEKDGVSYLIKSFAEISDEYKNYKLYIIGRFENKKTKKNVLELVKELNLDEKIVFTGPVKPDQMPILLKKSRLLALARPIQKQKAFGFATKIGEYLMTERPVVMTDVGNVKEYLIDGENVILARPNDEKDFAEKIRWVLQNKKAAEDIGKKGRDAAMQFFNSKIESDKIYKTIFSC